MLSSVTVLAAANMTPLAAHSAFHHHHRRRLSPHNCHPFPLKSNTTRTPLKRSLTRLIPSATAVADALDTPSDNINGLVEEQKQRMGVVVKVLEKPRVVLKFIWMEKTLGLALEQVIPGHGTIPLSPYYFWPRKDAWEELKSKLEEKSWISQKRMIILLNQATDIINLWQ